MPVLEHRINGIEQYVYFGIWFLLHTATHWFSKIAFISALSLCLFVSSTFVGQTILIFSGYTLKQSRSIRNEIIELSYRDSNNEINKEYIRERSFKEKMSNFIHFLKTGIEKSLIVPERDLIK